MTPVQLLHYIFRDTLNRRTGLEVIAGMATICAATIVTILCLAFTDSATILIERAIAPTRPVAGVLQVSSTTGTLSKVAQTALAGRLRELQATGKVEGVSYLVTSIEGSDLSFTDANGKPLSDKPTVWSVGSDAALLRPELGFKLLPGAGVGRMLTEPKAETTTSNAPILGILVNLAFMKKYMGYDDKLLEQVARSPGNLPKTLKLQFPPVPVDDDFVALPSAEVTVIGYFDEKSYPDLIVTLDVAALYYFEPHQQEGQRVKGRFGPTHPFHLLDAEKCTPLLSVPKDVPRNVVGLLPVRSELLKFPQFSKFNATPYDLVIVHVRNWKNEGERERIRDMLSAPTPIGKPFVDSVARSLHHALSKEDRAEVARTLANLTNLSPSLLIRRVDSQNQATERFEIHDVGNQSDFRVDVTATGQVQVFQLPAWRVTVPSATLTRSLTRVRGVIMTYSWAILWIVAILAAAAVLLLAFCHVLRKTRDIGLLFANGADSRRVFAIYLGEVFLIGLCGWVGGVVAAILLVPSARHLAKGLLTNLSEELAAGSGGGASVLQITLAVVLQSALWLLPATLAGSLYPARRATQTDPLTSLSKGA